MTPLKLSVMFATFPYGGNGGIPSTHPAIPRWIARTISKAEKDDRIQGIAEYELADTPITMSRNAAVLEARRKGVDVIVMIDSDIYPDYNLEKKDDRTQIPFWDAAFNFLYEHWHRGPVVIGAPYCGPSPFQNVYVFDWQNYRNDDPSGGFKLGPYTREHAAQMAGIQTCGALPTGLIMFDTRVFDLTEPDQQNFSAQIAQWLECYQGQELTSGLIKEISDRCEHHKFINSNSWFYYEYETDPNTGKCYQAEKASTEDVTVTRDIGLVGQMKLGYNPIHCAWSSWAGHIKLEIVSKPVVMHHEEVAEVYRKAAHDKISNEYTILDVGQITRASVA